MINTTSDLEFNAFELKNQLLNGRYRYISPIQDGSFGKVALAFDTVTRQEVALKAMYRSNVETKRMARHEIRMLTRLGKDCVNICQLLNHFETKNFIVLVLEYCPSGDLYDLIHSGMNISAVDMWSVSKQLVNAVKYCHSLGIYHRDIKPENVLFDAYGTVKLCDWGLSTCQRMSPHFNVGTEKYLAPECFKTEELEEYDTKYADYWSLGITLLTTVFGTSPFKPIGDKSLEMDTNFKNFTLYGKYEVLYDIYPTMNQNCFKIFMNLLKTGSVDDDFESKQAKIASRSVDKFLEAMEANWKFGLTIDEEYELEELHQVTEDSGMDDKSSDLFAMDHESNDGSLTSPTSYDDSSDELEGELEDEQDGFSDFNKSMVISIPEDDKYKNFGSSIPSLIASSTGKSWCDMDDEDPMGILVEGMKHHNLKTINEEVPSKKFEDMKINIQSKDIGTNLHAY